MALVDEERRYVAVNDAITQLYQFSRDEIIGRRAGSGMPDEDPAIGERIWQELVRTGEYYGEQLVRGSAGPPPPGSAPDPPGPPAARASAGPGTGPASGRRARLR